MKNPCRKCAPKANSRLLLILVNSPKQYVLVCHLYVTQTYSYVICMSLVYTNAVRMSLVYTRMSSVCHSYVIRMSLACTRISSVCHSYILLYHRYVTRMYLYVIRMYSYVTRMSLVFGLTMNHMKKEKDIPSMENNKGC